MKKIYRSLKNENGGIIFSTLAILVIVGFLAVLFFPNAGLLMRDKTGQVNAAIGKSVTLEQLEREARKNIVGKGAEAKACYSGIIDLESHLKKTETRITLNTKKLRQVELRLRKGKAALTSATGDDVTINGATYKRSVVMADMNDNADLLLSLRATVKEDSVALAGIRGDRNAAKANLRHIKSGLANAQANLTRKIATLRIREERKKMQDIIESINSNLNIAGISENPALAEIDRRTREMDAEEGFRNLTYGNGGDRVNWDDANDFADIMSKVDAALGIVAAAEVPVKVIYAE